MRGRRDFLWPVFGGSSPQSLSFRQEDTVEGLAGGEHSSHPGDQRRGEEGRGRSGDKGRQREAEV